MKKVFFHSIVFLFAANSQAQDSTFTIGIKGGLDWSGLAGKDIEAFSYTGDYESLTGQVVGVYANNKLSKRFWIKHELCYTRRFLNIKINDGTNAPFTSNVKRQYLEFYPANVTFHTKGFQAFTGLYAGFIVNATIQRKDTSGNFYIDKSFYYGNSPSVIYANKIDAGFTAGIEYEFNIGLNIGVHYNRGFVPILKNSAVANSLFNQFWGFSLGYSFIQKDKQNK